MRSIFAKLFFVSMFAVSCAAAPLPGLPHTDQLMKKGLALKTRASRVIDIALSIMAPGVCRPKL